MKTYKHLFEKLCSFENLQNAYEKARKHKTTTSAVQKFDEHWRLYLCILRKELLKRTYKPKPMQIFILRDPKTRKICVSNFKDRIVHHALVNVLQPIFEPRFIYDSYASRMGKGTSVALKRFDVFLRKVTKNGKCLRQTKNTNDVIGFALKADVKHYFDTVDHEILFQLISKRVKDDSVLWLTKVVLNHYHAKESGKGMPLGNWTSQFFANVYLNELDQFVKHKLKAKYYMRYVDDFVILHHSKQTLQIYEVSIKEFLQMLKLELHPNKCQIIPLFRGVSILGFRFFYHHTLVRERNIRKIYKTLQKMLSLYESSFVDAKDVLNVLRGWNAYASLGDTYRLRQRLTIWVVREYRREHPFPATGTYKGHDFEIMGLPVPYIIASFESLQHLMEPYDSESTFVPASDKADADFFVIASRLMYGDNMFAHMSVSSGDDRHRLGYVCKYFGEQESCPDKTDESSSNYCQKRAMCCPTAKRIVLEDTMTIPQRFADLFVTAGVNLGLYGSDPEWIPKYLHRATGGGLFDRCAPLFDLFSENPINIMSKRQAELCQNLEGFLAVAKQELLGE